MTSWWTQDGSSDQVSDLRAVQRSIAESPFESRPWVLYMSLEGCRWCRREVRYARVFRFFRAMFSPPRSW